MMNRLSNSKSKSKKIRPTYKNSNNNHPQTLQLQQILKMIQKIPEEIYKKKKIKKIWKEKI